MGSNWGVLGIGLGYLVHNYYYYHYHYYYYRDNKAVMIDHRMKFEMGRGHVVVVDAVGSQKNP